MRQTYHEETLYKNFQELFALLKRESKRNGAPGADRGLGDLRSFAEDELRMTAAFLQFQASDAPLMRSSGCGA